MTCLNKRMYKETSTQTNLPRETSEIPFYIFQPTRTQYTYTNKSILSNSKLKGPQKRIELYKNLNYESYAVSI